MKDKLITKNWGTDKIDLRAKELVAPVAKVRLDEIHLKEDGAKDDSPSLCLVMVEPHKRFVVSEISERMLKEALEELGYRLERRGNYDGMSAKEFNEEFVEGLFKEVHEEEKHDGMEGGFKDYIPYKSNCCDFRFVGMNHSPELNDMCRNCGGQWKGERASRYLDEGGGRGR